MRNTEDEFDSAFEKYPKKKKVDLSYEEYNPKKPSPERKKPTETIKSERSMKQPPKQKQKPIQQKKIVKKRPKREPNNAFGERVKDFFANAGLGEYLVIFTTVILLIAAVITLTKLESSKEIEAGAEALIPIGEQLSEVAVHSDVLVETIIASFTGGQEANRVLANLDESVEIIATFSSLMQDLKVKFVNKSTDELISGISFKIEIIPPIGESFTVTDEDKDGMIYVRDLEAGAYQVICKRVGNVKFSDTPVDVAVKDKLDYQKINIINEVKKESEINVSEEDIAEQDVVTESILQDTVAWITSTKTSVGDGAGYVEVLKDSITDPATVTSLASAFYKVDAVTETPTPEPTVEPPTYELSIPSITAGDKDVWVGVTILNLPSEHDVDYKWTVDGIDAGINIQAQILDEKMAIEGTIIVSCEITRKTKDDVPVVIDIVTKTATITVGPSPDIYVTLDKTEANISRLDINKLDLNATVENSVADNSVTWSSSDTAIATVDSNGLVTPVGGGEAIITVKTVEDKQSSPGTKAKATCTVTVAPLTISLKSATVGGMTPEKIYVGNTVDLTAKFTNRLLTDSITWMTLDVTTGTVTMKTKSTDTDVYTFKALKEGTVDITVSSTTGLGQDKSQPVAVYQFIISVDPKKDTTSKLNDNNGTQIYVKDGTTYREAKHADYYTYTDFYVKGAVEYTYTGWQTMSDNKTYYFDKNGNKVTGNQVIQGVSYSFSSVGILSMGDGRVGIDVSKYQGNIDWPAVKASGVDFAIIRCGYRGYTTGSLIIDPYFKQNIKGATNAGLKVGVYFFTQAITEGEAQEEASMALALTEGYNLSYPIFIDSEGSGGRADGLDVTTRTTILKAFCKTVTNEGEKAGIYASKNWYKNRLNVTQLNAYTIWMAQYATTATYTGRYDIWQHSSSGHVGGIFGNVDMNKSYLSY